MKKTIVNAIIASLPDRDPETGFKKGYCYKMANGEAGYAGIMYRLPNDYKNGYAAHDILRFLELTGKENEGHLFFPSNSNVPIKYEGRPMVREAGGRNLILCFRDANDNFVYYAADVVQSIHYKNAAVELERNLIPGCFRGEKFKHWHELCNLRKLPVEFASKLFTHAYRSIYSVERVLRDSPNRRYLYWGYEAAPAV